MPTKKKALRFERKLLVYLVVSLGHPTLFSILAWRIPRTEESGGLQSIGFQRVGHYWSNWACKLGLIKNFKIYRSVLASNDIKMFQYGIWWRDLFWIQFSSVQSLSCVQLFATVDCSTPGFPIHHQFPELTQTHVHRVGDAIQPAHPL